MDHADIPLCPEVLSIGIYLRAALLISNTSQEPKPEKMSIHLLPEYRASRVL